MAVENSKLEDSVAWANAHPAQTIVGGLAILALLAVLISSLNGQDPDPEAFAITTSTTSLQGAATSTTVAAAGDEMHPDVPQLTCARLITDDEADAAIFGADASGPRGMFTFSSGETCTFDPNDDSGKLVQIEPGDPSDLADGARLGGVVGEAVTDVGDQANWFDDPDTGAGVLAVGVDADLGALIYRIRLSRPDLDSAARLEIAQQLALAALPRFPGVTIEKSAIEPTVITFPDEPADLPAWGLDDALYEGIATGRWSLGEGLVAVLGSIADGVPGDVAPDVEETSGSMVIAAAQSYVAGGGEHAGEIEAKLDDLLPSAEELDRLAPPDATAFSRLIVASAFFAARQGADCGDSEANPCYAKVPLDEYTDIDSARYSLYIALPSKWTEAEIEIVKEALHDSAVTYQGLGQMPVTELRLTPGDRLYASYIRGKDCRASVGDFLVGKHPDEMKQILAREIAFCFISHDAYSQLFENPNPVRWLVHGLANYLSGVVYPATNIEHRKLPARLAQEELSTTLQDRSWTNWILFEHLHGFIGPDGIMDMLRGFPAGGDLVSALATSTGMPEFYHDLERALSDANVSDVGPGTVPYEPQAWDLPLTGPSEVPLDVPQFGVRRLHIQVPPGEYACVDSFSQGALRMSWRPGAPGEPGSWSDELPQSFEGEAVFVLTSVEPGAFYTLEVNDVSTEPDCQHDEETDGGSPFEDCDICGPSTYYWGDLVLEP